jgi:DNA-binding phage protein
MKLGDIPEPAPIGTCLMSAIVTRRRTLSDVATVAGMQTAQLSRVLTGQVDPRWSTIARLCKALEMAPEDLFRRGEGY